MSQSASTVSPAQSAALADLGNLDITSREFKANSDAIYARLRREAPVYRTVLPDKMPVWIVSRYDDAAMVLKDERFSKSFQVFFDANPGAKPPWIPKVLEPLMHHMLHSDPPDHTRLRTLVQQAFKPSLVERLRPRIADLAGELLAAAHKSGEVDLICQFALPIPATIIAEMLGVPVEDRHKFHRWTQRMLASGGQKFRMIRNLPTIWLFARYLHQLIKMKRRSADNDLLSALVEAEEGGERLTEDELVAMVFLLLIAGHETTVNLIGNGVLALIEHSDQMQRLRQEPGIIKSAVEELLRFTSPVETSTERFAREPITIAGVDIPRGALVLPSIASANRDEQHFPNPDQLDLTREPNKHLAFGLGPHFCLGAPLARLEAQIAFNMLLERTVDIQLAIPRENLRWNRGLILRGLASLPLRVTWR